MISKDDWKVSIVCRATGCDQETATEYLDAEEWDEEDAVTSLRGDEEAKLARHQINMLSPSYRRAQRIIENESAP